MSSRGYVFRLRLQDAAAATGNGVELDVAGCPTASLQVSGTFSATVTFEGTVDGANWIAIQMTNLNAGTASTTATAAGLFAGNVAGLLKIRARISAYTSGNVTVDGIVTTAPR